jgi:hypothetical protein
MRWKEKYPANFTAMKFTIEHHLLKHLDQVITKYGRRRFAVAFGLDPCVLMKHRALARRSATISSLWLFYLWSCAGGEIVFKDKEGEVIFQTKGEIMKW